MRSFTVLLAQLVSICFVASAFAQGSAWQPSRFPPFDFRDAAAAKIYSSENSVTVLGMVSPEIGTRTINVSKTRTETRSRTVKDPQTGEELEQSYAVEVPYTEQIEQTFIMRRRIEVPVEDAKIWTFSGKALSAAEARTALSSAKRCFCIANQRRKYNYQGDPFFAEMLTPDVLVIWYDKTKATDRTEIPPVKNE